MHRHKDSPGLSLLAQGRGLLDGGVEIECFGDDRTAYSLNGESFLRASQSPEGQFAKPYRVYQLALPKTYVTRRGQMVLFTSPNDMIVGQSAALHRREGTSQTAASHLKTVPNLVTSSLAYQPEKSAPSEAGQFTSVYLERLREAAQKAKQAENCQAVDLEKGDAGKEGEDEMDAADSGVGPSLRPSSGRLSSLSHFSSTDGTIVNIPDGRFSVAELEEEESEDIAMETREPVDPLQQLVGELSGYMPHGSKPTSKSKPTKQTKKKKVVSSESTTSRKDKPKPPREGGRGKNKKKKKKKTHRGETAVLTEGGVVLEDGGVGIIQNGQKEGEGVGGVGVEDESTADRNKRLRAASALRRTQVAEERRLEMERKRAEKKALERQRALEEEERARLEEQLRKLQEQAQTSSGAHMDLRSRLQLEEALVGGDKVEAEEEGERVVVMTEVVEEEQGDKKVEQSHRVPPAVPSGIRRREGEARIGSSFREEMARRRREDEQRRKKRLEAERAEKARLAHEKGVRLREKANYQNHQELAMNRLSQSISRPYTFSYFQYVPPKMSTGKGGGKEKGRAGSRTKRKK